MQNNEIFWNKISSKYDLQVKNKYEQTYINTIKKTRNYLKETDVALDYACGTGITTVELARDVKQIYAIDISQDMINIAKEKSQKNNISNIKYDVTDVFDEKYSKESFDVLMAFNILYFIKDTNSVIKRINELLKPGGVFISATDCLGEKRTFKTMIGYLLGKIGIVPSMKMFKMDQLKNIIKRNGFSIVETENLYDSPPNLYIVAKKVKNFEV